ncbi:hypothetical protein [Bradyrhizobium sp. SZCCHNS2015]|uniref:hypothetical protein n=1 Tax=Bradyrhizobium sp. SZCCHNS2015 TaxID=3057305 RepID=UPI0028EC2F27|nr:hypothetical protein [Bradyrhizobium sp. SZCCHNS2015]
MSGISRRHLLAILSGAVIPASAFAGHAFAPAEHFFSVEFPTPPEEKSSGLLGLSSTTFLATDGNKAFAVFHAAWPIQGKPALMMQSVLDGLVERVSGEFLSIDKTEFKSSSGAMLPAKRFTFSSDKVWGGGLTTVSGPHSFLVQVMKRKPLEGWDAADRKFMASFKVLI